MCQNQKHHRIYNQWLLVYIFQFTHYYFQYNVHLIFTKNDDKNNKESEKRKKKVIKAIKKFNVLSCILES